MMRLSTVKNPKTAIFRYWDLIVIGKGTLITEAALISTRVDQKFKYDNVSESNKNA